MAINLWTSAGTRPLCLFAVTEGSESTATAKIPNAKAARRAKTGLDIVISTSSNASRITPRVYWPGTTETRILKRARARETLVARVAQGFLLQPKEGDKTMLLRSLTLSMFCYAACVFAQA